MIIKGLSKVLVFFLYLVSLLPMWFLYLIADVLYILLYYVIKYRKQVVYENLKNSFPNKSHSELKVIQKEYFKYLTDLMLEIVKMLSASPDFIFKRYTFTNTQLIEKFESEKRSYLFCVGHYGNWEWSSIVTPMTVNAKTLIIYKPLNNHFFDDLFKKTREKSGSVMVNMKNVLREIVKRKNELTVTVFAADQTPAGIYIQQWLPFLNQPTPVFTGIEKIAKTTNSPVIFCDMQRVKRGYYACDFKLVAENPNDTDDLEITKKYLQLLEDRINIEPAYWLWSHKRWKHKPRNKHEQP